MHPHYGRGRNEHLGTLRRAWRGALLRLKRLSLYKSALLSEFCSLLPRTKYRMRRNLDMNGVDLGSLHHEQPNGHLALNTRTRTRIRDMQYLLSKFPEATLVDLSIFLEGWDRGEESQLALADNSCSERSVQGLS